MRSFIFFIDLKSLLKQLSTVNASGSAFVAFEVEDADVEAEHLRVENLFSNKDHYDREALVIRELKKRFGRLTAVDGISFGVHNQVFVI